MAKDEATGNFEKLEFWALTALFIFSLPAFLNPYVRDYFEAGELIRYVAFFLIFFYVNFRLAPKVIEREQPGRSLLIGIALLAIMTVLHLIVSKAIESDPAWSFDDNLRAGFLRALLVALTFAGYVTLKQAVLYMISKADFIRSFFVIFNRDSLVVIALWVLLAYCMAAIRVPIELWFVWLTVVPTGAILHGLSFNFFIPRSLRRKYPLISYFFKVFIFCFAIAFVIALPIIVITGNEERSFVIGAFSGVLHFVLTAPALWLVYRWRMKGREEIYALQSELGRSAANVDFLRSQINPHFLFNALNTIYGLAIHEKAERTSEAIQKLGEMMRFMLNENTQERIPLDREIEYLSNYISLQKLRTDSNPHLRIQVDVADEVSRATRITPMLLIPFVENAFKHGISLREDSYIKISLELKKTTLYFDVLNSTHPKTGNDPEKNSNGIGLANVKHRLQHMYAGRHELMIRETSHDFFVHLRLELD